jgi:hypothetical protein
MQVGVAARTALVRSADGLPWVVGGCLVWLGSLGSTALALVGSTFLVAAGALLFARLNGFALPRPGRVRIVAQGCWEVPQAFFVRYRDRALLFQRAFAQPGAEPGDAYCVIALPADSDGQSMRFAGFVPPEDSRLLGFVPARDLRFEHRGGDFVYTAFLSAALGRVSSPADPA